MENDNLSESFKKLGESISEIARGIINTFSEALKEVLKLMEKKTYIKNYQGKDLLNF